MKIIPQPRKIEAGNGFCSHSDSDVLKIVDEKLSDEEYILEVNCDEIKLTGGSSRALFYGEKTLEQLRAQYNQLPVCKIYDKPKYEYRSFMIDCARHMFDIAELKKIIDAMALFKFNKFHWHLTDDQGWRFESDTYSALNEKAGVRPSSNFGKQAENSPYGRVYTKAEMKEIVAFCAERYIDVIPEFDIPGHTSALLSVFPEITCSGMPVAVKTRQGIYEDVVCPAKDKSYEIISNIFDELCSIFPYKYYHIGGDETPDKHWQSCPDCQKLMKKHGITSHADYHNFFMNKMIEYLSFKGKTCVLWNDVAKGSQLDSRAIIQYWKEGDKNSIAYANNGGKMVLSPFSYYYMDYDYDIIPMNHTLSFDTDLKGLTQHGKDNILGVEVPIWTEYIDNNKRLEEMLFPRALAVANTGWCGSVTDYNAFVRSMEPAAEMLKNKNISLMEQKRWKQSRLAMPKGWLKFVFEHYTFDYIKSMIK